MAETGYQAWLRFDQRSNEQNAAMYGAVLQQVVVAGAYSDGLLQTAVKELIGGIGLLTGKRPVVRSEPKAGSYLILGTFGSSPLIDDQVAQNDPVRSEDESYRIKAVGLTDDRTGGESESHRYILLAGSTEKGILYGVFHLLRLMQTGQAISGLDISEKPRFTLRMLNQWDNMDGSVERGYSGDSIFYSNNKVLSGSRRIRDYARLLASVGINGIAINNVNVHKTETLLIAEKYLPDVAKVAAVFREYGIKLFLSVNYAGPLELGDLDTADPLDSGVRAWWRAKADEVYRYIPDFGGFLVKADSENRPGPFTYGRDHADGANMLAEAVRPYGGLVLWRCFVYNCHQDWRDRSTDRARAAYDHFKPLDGKFMDNVILQIKNGPMDFQVREPVSPLFGAMEKTNQMMEFQIAQEYTGQQIDVCYLVPQWKQVLDFDTYRKGAGSTVKDIAAGKVHPYVHSGITAVSNIGDDENWTGHHLAQANLFGYGRLIWNPELTAEEIAEEWSLMTFGPDRHVGETVTGFLMQSWPIYEKYTSPLGVGWMVRPHYHYGVDVDGYEYSKWGTYHFADWRGIGVDRTLATGTGYTGQYVKENRERYDSLETCPDELLLFFHHVPYKHKLKSGKSVIQHIYDTHFEGMEELEYWINRWVQLEGTVDEDRYRHIMGRLERQLDNAKQWRDVINTYFYRKSGIADEKGRTIY